MRKKIKRRYLRTYCEGHDTFREWTLTNWQGGHINQKRVVESDEEDDGWMEWKDTWKGRCAEQNKLINDRISRGRDKMMTVTMQLLLMMVIMVLKPMTMVMMSTSMMMTMPTTMEQLLLLMTMIVIMTMTTMMMMTMMMTSTTTTTTTMMMT